MANEVKSQNAWVPTKKGTGKNIQNASPVVGSSANGSHPSGGGFPASTADQDKHGGHSPDRGKQHPAPPAAGWKGKGAPTAGDAPGQQGSGQRRVGHVAPAVVRG